MSYQRKRAPGNGLWAGPIAGVIVLVSLGSVFQAARVHDNRLHPMVLLVPGKGGGYVQNNCVPTACLETLKHPRSHVMLVRYVSGEGHAYCLWSENRRLFASDRRGAVEIFPTSGGVMGIARALPIPYGGLVVESAYIMPSHKQGERK